MATTLDSYVTLGRSGLRVSPLCLGTMTFGTEWGWGAPEDTARAMFDGYVEAGGNFVDTADAYTNGQSEELVGRFIRDRELRDRIVLATKYTINFNAGPHNPNSSGNGRKNLYRALERSLRRLGTDYVDLYWMHAWDTVTPVEEVISSLNDLVRAGKIRYFGFSDVPAWYVARAQTLAEKEGKERLIALQLEYSLIERNIEREHVPAAQELGIGITPWSPLAGGFLTGKYTRDGEAAQGEGRIAAMQAHGPSNPLYPTYSEREWQTLDVLLDAAKQMDRSPAQIALNWAATQPGITSTIIGATKPHQLEDNLGSLGLDLPADLRDRLDEASAPEPAHPYVFFGPKMQAMISGAPPPHAWRPQSVYGAPIELPKAA